MIVKHLIERNYQQVIDPNLIFSDQVVELAYFFRERLISLVANWMRVGYCQGNFNSDNCAAGGFTLDYGPFGFCELFEPRFQPWTGGGEHFSFFNQPVAAEANFQMFWTAIRPLLTDNTEALARLDQIRDGFAKDMSQEIEGMWAKKLGLINYDATLVNELLQLMVLSKVDYTVFFRKLSNIPAQMTSLKESFYHPSSEKLDKQWDNWLLRWRDRITSCGKVTVISKEMSQEIAGMWAKKLGLINYDATLVNELLQLMVLSKVDYTNFFRKLSNIPEQMTALKESFYLPSSEQIDKQWANWLLQWRDRIKSCGERTMISNEMKRINPKYTWREWLIEEAYKKAEQGDYSLIKELQIVLSNPYDEQASTIAMKYDVLKPKKFFNVGGVSHYSCSS